MKFTRINIFPLLATTGLCALSSFQARGQSASSIYTWNGTGDIQAWIRSFGALNTSATLGNTVAGEFTITETSTALGGSQAFSDGFNRVRELPTGPSGGLDLTGLTSLQFDVGHNGVSPINVQFYVQASVGSSFVALGPDLSVLPGINTYTVPLSGLTLSQAVYVRTIGLNVRDHAALGNVTWTVQEVRSAGPGLTTRNLANFDGTVEGGLQGAIVNFDGASVVGNAGQNQSGLSWNNAGTGSLQWTDVAGGAGGAITLGNGTAWSGNSFNNRTTDVSNYGKMIVRMSATETSTANGGSLNIGGFFQKNNFSSFANAGASQNLAIDGQFHDVVFEYFGLPDMNVVDQIGLNLGSHTDELRINVDNILFTVPEPTSGALFGLALVCLGIRRIRRAS